jgi:ribokinase
LEYDFKGFGMITVFGSTNLDQIGTVSRLPAPGETVAGGTFSTAAGGKGANQALAARRAGASVRHVSAVGSDHFAEQALALLAEAGVDLSTIRRVPGATGIAMIFVDAEGENVIAILPGANGAVSPADADAALQILAPSDIVLLQQEVPQAATERAMDIARARGATTIFNTAPFLPETPALAKKAAIVVCNETEFALLCGQAHGPIDAIMTNWAKSNNQTLIVTLGGDGVKTATPDHFFHVPALSIEPVDTVGAGDTFCGYLGAGLDTGLPLELAVRRAAVAASLACLKAGAQPAIPLAADVDMALAD